MNRPLSPFDIKSARITGLALLLRTRDLADITAELDARVADAGDLFTNAPVLIDVSALHTDDSDDTVDGADTIDLAALVELLGRHTMRAVGIVGASGALLAQAQALGLIEEIDIRPRTRHNPPPPAIEPAETAALGGPDSPETPREAFDGAAVQQAVGHAVAGLTAPTMVLDRPLRSGQRVYARGGDLIVLGVVNHGAEVIADGNIHVYGPLRGRAIAGASGDTQARIFAAAMEPELISIAGSYRTADKPLAADVLGKPAQARLDGDRMLIEPLKS
jgi:septum site-determining protein MinC